MPNPKTHSCGTCGYIWVHGQHGGHDCSTYLSTLVGDLKTEILRKDDDIVLLRTHVKNLERENATFLVRSLLDKLERDPWIVDYLDQDLIKRFIRVVDNAKGAKE